MSRHVRIIIVASDESVRKMLTMVVQVEYVAEVVSVRGGKAALEAVPRLQPKMVIIHGNLQGMRALTLAARLHAITDLAKLPIVLTHALDVSENDR